MNIRKANKDAIKTIAAMYKEKSTVYFTDIPFSITDQETVSLNVKSRLNLDEMNAFVTSITGMLFDENGAYRPVVLKPAIDILTIKFYAGIDISFDNAMSAKYIADRIREHVDQYQYEDMLNCIDDAIAFERNVKLSAERIHLQDCMEESKSCVEKCSEIIRIFQDVDLNKILDATDRLAPKKDTVV